MYISLFAKKTELMDMFQYSLMSRLHQALDMGSVRPTSIFVFTNVVLAWFNLRAFDSYIILNYMHPKFITGGEVENIFQHPNIEE
jgi:hypothetical protein